MARPWPGHEPAAGREFALAARRTGEPRMVVAGFHGRQKKEKFLRVLVLCQRRAFPRGRLWVAVSVSGLEKGGLSAGLGVWFGVSILTLPIIFLVIWSGQFVVG